MLAAGEDKTGKLILSLHFINIVTLVVVFVSQLKVFMKFQLIMGLLRYLQLVLYGDFPILWVLLYNKSTHYRII